MTEKTAWQIDPGDSDVISQTSPHVDGDVICQMPAQQFKLSLAEWPEHARLICAAPDLLAACEAVLEWELPQAGRPLPIPWDTGVLPLLRAAVAKATGADAPDEPESDDCLNCTDEASVQSPMPDEPAPALKAWWISADQGEVLCLNAERVDSYSGDLVLRTGEELVGRVAAGRWIAYWQDGAGSHFDA